VFCGINETPLCKFCGFHNTKRLISATSHYCGNEEPAWLRKTVEIVDKDGGRHCQEFIKHPTRANYRKWMKGESIRPIEPGEKLRKPEHNSEKIRKYVKDQHYKRRSLEIR
jgi:hypothetical protein